MADTIARREARRRKILENSQSRLEKISGRKEKPIIEKETTIEEPSTNDSNEIVSNGSPPSPLLGNKQLREQLINSMQQNKQLSDIILKELEKVKSSNAFKIRSELNNATQMAAKPRTNLKNKLIFEFRLIIICLAISICLFNHILFNSIDLFFLPIFIYESIELTMIGGFTKQNDSLSLIKSVLLLFGLSESVSSIISNLISFIKKFSTDVTLYIFFFVITDAFLKVSYV